MPRPKNVSNKAAKVPPKCRICGFLCRNHYRRTRHEERHALGARAHSCDNCGDLFCSESHLNSHVKQMHERQFSLNGPNSSATTSASKSKSGGRNKRKAVNAAAALANIATNSIVVASPVVKEEQASSSTQLEMEENNVNHQELAEDLIAAFWPWMDDASTNASAEKQAAPKKESSAAVPTYSSAIEER